MFKANNGIQRVTLGFASTLLALSSCLASDAQSSEPAAMAKRHYQNAVAAIGKDDWHTAERELLQAEKLAPQNALVRYDLALAYSHTGKDKFAQAELHRALQLGLPAEQKQAAEELAKRLQAEPPTKPAGAPAAPDKGEQVDTNAQRLEEAKTFLTSRLSGLTFRDTSVSGTDLTYTQSVSFDGCKMLVYITYITDGPQGSFSQDADLSQLDPTSARVHTEPHIARSSSVPLEFYPTNNGHSIRFTDTGGRVVLTDRIVVNTNGDETDRITRAMSTAITICGGKKGAF